MSSCEIGNRPDLLAVAQGTFSRKEVYVSYENRNDALSKEAINFLEKTWRKETSSRKLLFDGKLFRVASFKIRQNGLLVFLENTTYKNYVGTRTSQFEKKFGTQGMSNPLTVGAVIFTEDRKLIVGTRRANLDREGSKIGVVAGMMDRTKDFSDDKPDPFGAILREMREEVDIKEDKVQSISSLGLAYDRKYKQFFMPFKLEVDLTFEEIIHRKPTHQEFRELHFFRADPRHLAEAIVGNHRRMARTCLTNLLLFGSSEYGTGWNPLK
ncbi:MAG: NUDIX hydrolase [Candidatus Bathyarchaeia archaeon]